MVRVRLTIIFFPQSGTLLGSVVINGLSTFRGVWRRGSGTITPGGEIFENNAHFKAVFNNLFT
jgi:hypothetical protein